MYDENNLEGYLEPIPKCKEFLDEEVAESHRNHKKKKDISLFHRAQVIVTWEHVKSVTALFIHICKLQDMSVPGKPLFYHTAFQSIKTRKKTLEALSLGVMMPMPVHSPTAWAALSQQGSAGTLLGMLLYAFTACTNSRYSKTLGLFIQKHV
jgi:hypothetical protein